MEILSTCLFNQTIRRVNKKNSLMFFLTPLLWNATIYKRKIANLAVLYNFLCNSQMNAYLNIFRMSRKERKEGREFEGGVY